LKLRVGAFAAAHEADRFFAYLWGSARMPVGVSGVVDGRNIGVTMAVAFWSNVLGKFANFRIKHPSAGAAVPCAADQSLARCGLIGPFVNTQAVYSVE